MFKALMFKHTLMAVALFAAGGAHALSAGDVAFTSFNADEDGWTLAALASIAANTTIYFTDNEWNGSSIGAGGAFNGGESFHVWNSGANLIAAGTVIRFTQIDSTTLGVSAGSFARASVSGSTNYGISTAADTLYAYQGSSATSVTNFLASISSGVYGTAADGSLAGTGLSIGAGAVQVAGGADYAEYIGARSGKTTFGAYLPDVSNVANWTGAANTTNSLDFSSTVPNTTAFSVTPVPEPEQLAMLLSGLGLLGFIARRRTR